MKKPYESPTVRVIVPELAGLPLQITVPPEKWLDNNPALEPSE